MKNEIVYMLGVIAVGFLVNYALRALPFLLFAGKDRTLPRGIERFSIVLSPIIIAALIIYSYSGLAWRTPWPYLAGLVTVALQLFWRNALGSIVAGTLVYMCLLSTGCVSRPPITLDSQNPSVSISPLGLKIGNELVGPEDILDALEDNDIPKTRVIHILLEPDVRDMRPARQFMTYLRAKGYSRPILVTKRHGESLVTGKQQPKSAAKPAAPSVAKPKRVR